MTNQNLANIVISVLNEMNVDSETMEHIINQVGMREQMINQLYLNKLQYEAENKVNIVDPKEPVFMLTKQEIIDYTRTIQERAWNATEEAIKGVGGDFEQYVELELSYTNCIDITVDEDSLLREVIDSVSEVFETDDEAVYSEVLDVLEHLHPTKMI